MQGKGLVKFAAIALTIACLYSLSFTWIANKVESDAQEFANGNTTKEKLYLDSVASLPVFSSLSYITYQYAKEREIPLGLDLKGGMNVTMEISLSEMVRNLANNSTDANFNAAIKNAEVALIKGDNDFITVFGKEFEKLSPNSKLAPIFATKENSANLKIDADNEAVLNFLRKSADGAIDLSFNILRTRIDKFGVTAPNIQKQQGTNRILIELPGVTDQNRVRKLLQGSAKLEFWETYDNTEIFGLLQNVNSILASTVKPTDSITTPANSQDTAKSKLAALGKKDSSVTDSTAALDQLQADQAKQNPLFAVMSPATYQGQDGQTNLRPGPVVGYAALKDTAKVNAYLSSPQVKSVIPQNIKLYWGVKAI